MNAALAPMFLDLPPAVGIPFTGPEAMLCIVSVSKECFPMNPEQLFLLSPSLCLLWALSVVGPQHLFTD